MKKPVPHGTFMETIESIMIDTAPGIGQPERVSSLPSLFLYRSSPAPGGNYYTCSSYSQSITYARQHTTPFLELNAI